MGSKEKKPHIVFPNASVIYTDLDGKTIHNLGAVIDFDINPNNGTTSFTKVEVNSKTNKKDFELSASFSVINASVFEEMRYWDLSLTKHIFIKLKMIFRRIIFKRGSD